MKSAKKAFGDISLVFYYIVYVLISLVIATGLYVGILAYLSENTNNVRIVNIETEDHINEINNDNEINIDINISKKGASKVDSFLIYAADAYFIIMYPAFMFLGVAVGTIVFYFVKLRRPIWRLRKAAERIADNDLDFKIENNKNDVLGRLCDTFETMRAALYNNNIQTWRMIDEMKRVQATFSHDLRTPMTVIQGYADYLETYIPTGKISEEKLLDTVKKISNNTERLINFTVSMSTLNKIDLIEIKPTLQSVNEYFEVLKSDAKIICKDKKSEISFDTDCETASFDREIISEVAENIISNGARYAEALIKISFSVKQGIFRITVKDDGPGFSNDALVHCTEAYYTENQFQGSGNFGIGLSISKTLCQKYNGYLTVSNHSKGGFVEAVFNINPTN